ncbi:MAG: nuclear transport factor 2 family protein [Rhodospirillales bacterium]|jgi:hypothetical protein|nr:nuclear transport factor 2 family protein [Rhodospirillales bacterium]
MERSTERDIEWDCTQVIIQFYNDLDARRYDTLVGLFAPDGIWMRQGEEVKGRDKIMEIMAGRPGAENQQIRHMVSNIQVSVVDENTANTQQYVTIYRHDSDEPIKGPAPMEGGPGIIFLYEDEMMRTPDGWKISHKKGRPLLRKKH